MHDTVKQRNKKQQEPSSTPLFILYQTRTPRAPSNNTIIRVAEVPVCGQLIKQLSGPEKRITLI